MFKTVKLLPLKHCKVWLYIYINKHDLSAELQSYCKHTSISIRCFLNCFCSLQQCGYL